MMKEELEKIIQKAAIDGTLTESAAEQVQQALEENKSLKVQVSELESLVESKTSDLYEEQDVSRERLEALRKWEERESDLVKREKQATELELEAKWQAQRVADHQIMVDRVFRNVETRRNVFTATPPPTIDQYNNPQYGGWNEHEQKETQE